MLNSIKIELLESINILTELAKKGSGESVFSIIIITTIK